MKQGAFDLCTAKTILSSTEFLLIALWLQIIVVKNIELQSALIGWLANQWLYMLYGDTINLISYKRPFIGYVFFACVLIDIVFLVCLYCCCFCFNHKFYPSLSVFDNTLYCPALK